MPTRRDTVIRRRLCCRGIVQGVGFRPAVHRLATALGLCGFVRNDADGATIEVEGEADMVAIFEGRLPKVLPALARLDEVAQAPLAPSGARTFEIAASSTAPRGDAMVPADAALCARCRAELDDPRDRRHRYAFVNCTECGPRFSIVRALPYDRARTAMACFPMCARCAAEYADPASRRFHAEATCCPDCGPRLWLADASGHDIATGPDALAQAQRRLAAGAIVAIKGLGGFQLACRADVEAAVVRLRQRKRRARKPLAVMVRDVEVARRLAALTDADVALLASPAAPIVLAPRRPGGADGALAAAVAIGVDDVGLMLPTTPLHVELFRGASFDALVATSGNGSDEPICLGNREALHRLGDIADAWLLHDRDVVRRVDDSVVRAAEGGPVVVRRSRGFAPTALPLPVPAASPVLALGGHLQTTACLATGARAFVSQHIGDLDTEASRAFLREVALGLEQFLECEAYAIAADAHPDYASTWLAAELAQQRDARLLSVPHHLAHAAAVLGERGAFPRAGERAAALVLDGTGFGPDGTAWGCELIVLDGALRWERAACGEALPLVGGEAAVREPWRIAAAVLGAAGRDRMLTTSPLARLAVAGRRLADVAALARRSTWPRAHGAGRLFEAAGALLGLCACNDYEGEAAAVLEAVASRCAEDVPPWPEVPLADGPPGPEVAPREGAPCEVPQRALLLAAAQRAIAGEPAARVARGLLRTFAARWAEMVACRLPVLRTLALGGGCLVNRLLRRDLTRELGARGVEALLPRELPPGDGGLAYGQAVVAAVALARRCEPRFVASLDASPRGSPDPTRSPAEEPSPCASPSP